MCIDPFDYNTGAANTIQRAELVGIFKALQVDHAGSSLKICTDSLASMYIIDKHMRCPTLHRMDRANTKKILSLEWNSWLRRPKKACMYSCSR